MIEIIPWMSGPHAQKVRDPLASTRRNSIVSTSPLRRTTHGRQRQGVSQEFEDAFGDDEVQPARGGHRHDDPEPELVYLLAQSKVREVTKAQPTPGAPSGTNTPKL